MRLLLVVLLSVLGLSMGLTFAHAHAQSQVALTASYSVIGGGVSNSQDLFTYIDQGVTTVVPLSTSPHVYEVDSGSPWSVQTELNGSSLEERWLASTGDFSGSITLPLTISFTYYHQYRVIFNYNLTGGGGGLSAPLVTFSQFGASVTEGASTQWVDAGTSYSYNATIPNAPQGQEWVAPGITTGTISNYGPVSVTYNHEFLVTSSYSASYGSPPSAPQLSVTVFGKTTSVDLTLKPNEIWADAGTNYTFTSLFTDNGGTERWIGTTQTGAGLTVGTYAGVLAGPVTVSIVFVHQYFVTVGFSFIGGGLNAGSGPSLSYQSFGVSGATSTNISMWVDANSQYFLPQDVLGASQSQERWELNNVTSGSFVGPTEISAVYFHQYYVPFAFAVLGQAPPSPSGQPNLSYVLYGNTLSLTLTSTPQSEWTDAGSSYSTTSTLSSSTNSERWFAQNATSAISGSSINGVTLDYVQQYLLTLHGGALQNQWVNAGANTTLNTPGVYGRSQGTGYRLISYYINQGVVVNISQPLLTLSIPISMNGPESITFQSTIQFQLTLDAGATAALSSITPTTILGDSGNWYDDGSVIQVVLNGAYDRAHGVGSRVTSVAATGEGTLQVDTVGTFEAYNTTSLATPVSITTTSVTQYEVVLNQAAQAALVSVTPASSFPGDNYWFNSGSPAVTVVLQGAYSRANGIGMRTTSWELNAGGFTKVAQTGVITITTKALNSAQFVNATNIVQYEVTMDKGGSQALVSISSPTISGDTGWFDSGTQVQVLMNGEWGRSGGTGNRLAGYSIDGGSPVLLTSAGQTDILNLAAISSPEPIVTMVVTQYQVTLDQGATSALSLITPTPISTDKYWYDSGTVLTISLNGIWGRTANFGDRLLSYSVNKGPTVLVASKSTVQVYSNDSITGPVSVTTTTGLQYHLTSSSIPWVSVTAPALSGDSGWYDAGTPAKATFNNTWSLSPGTRESAISYSIDSGSKTALTRAASGSFVVSLTMSQAHTISIQTIEQFLVAIVGPQKVTASPPSPTGDLYFDSGSKVTFTTTRLWNGTQAGSENLLTSYSIDGAPPVAVPTSTSATFTTPALTFNEGQILTFNSMPQYEVLFTFLDHLGGQTITPAQIGLTEGNTSVQVNGNTAWVGNGTTFTVSNVIWEGASVGPIPPPSFTMKAAPMNVTLETYTYSASIHVVDLFGLPVPGAQISMTLANGTTISGTTKSDGTYTAGLIPLGTYTAKVTSLGVSSKVTGNAGEAVAQGRVVFGIISLFVIVAVAAAAAGGGFLYLRKFRKGRVSALK